MKQIAYAGYAKYNGKWHWKCTVYAGTHILAIERALANLKASFDFVPDDLKVVEGEPKRP